MSSDEKGRKMAQLDQTLDLGARVRWFIRGNYTGGGTIKRLCREFDWNESKAKRVFNGEGIRNEDLDEMAKRWGWRFVHFIFSPVAGVGWDVSRAVEQQEASLRDSAAVFRAGPFSAEPRPARGGGPDLAPHGVGPADRLADPVAGGESRPAAALADEVKKAAE